MSLTTLHKFLQQSSPQNQPVASPADEQTHLKFANQTLTSIQGCLLSDEVFLDLSDEIESARESLDAQGGVVSWSHAAATVETALAEYQRRLRRMEEDRSAEFRNTLDMLNEVLSHLSADTQKTELRRTKLEGSLTMASRMDNMAALRSHLSNVLHSVREEGKQDKERSQKVIDNLGRRIQQVETAERKFITNFPGRPAALDFLAATPHDNLHVAIFVADSLPSIRERHGEEIAKSILQDFGRHQLQLLMPEGSLFAWSPHALLLVWHHRDETTSSCHLSSRLKLPYEHRAFVGTRVAVFSVALRSLVIQVHDSTEEVVSKLDQFSRRSGS